MLAMNVFNQDAFSAASLTAAVDKIDYVPDQISAIPGLFEPDPVRTDVIWIEERSTGSVILPFSPRGAPPHQTGGDIRKARSFQTLRYGDASRITASELFAIRKFGSEVDLKTLQEEVARRQRKILLNNQLTKEYHKLNCITAAQVKDADGTVIYNWATEFGQALPAEVDFDLDAAAPASGVVRRKCTAIRRSIQVALKGVGRAREIVGLCGDAFWDDLVAHPEVVATYNNWAAAADLRNGFAKEWQAFRYGDITFINYRSTDDGTTLGVGTDKCKFFPTGAGIFRWAMSPGESFADLGTEGKDSYSRIVTDKDRDAWADVEVFSYPLPVCTMPGALASARRT